MALPPHESHHIEHHSDRIKRRLLFAVSVQFVLLMGVGAIQGFWPDGGPGRETAVLILLGCAALIPIVTAILVRPVLSSIESLDDERVRLLTLYGRARKDAMVDVLTGLGNHRAFRRN